MERFPELLKNAIEKGVPGSDVQWQMASSDRMVKNFPHEPGPDARPAAVMILLFPFKGSVHTVFMQRHDYKGVHGGQISFPGGKWEPGDDSLISTALRETYEETGAGISLIKVIGTLTPLFIPVSNMIVTPVVGWAKEKPHFCHQPEEVLFLFDAVLQKFLDRSIIKNRMMLVRGEKINVKHFDYDGNVIWGATAMMLNELLLLMQREGITC